jgi:hypothetical protein
LIGSKRASDLIVSNPYLHIKSIPSRARENNPWLWFGFIRPQCWQLRAAVAQCFTDKIQRWAFPVIFKNERERQSLSVGMPSEIVSGRSSNYSALGKLQRFTCQHIRITGLNGVGDYNEYSDNFENYCCTVFALQTKPPMPESIERPHHWLAVAVGLLVVVVGAFLVAVGFCGLVAAINSGTSLILFLIGIAIFVYGLGFFDS